MFSSYRVSQFWAKMYMGANGGLPCWFRFGDGLAVMGWSCGDAGSGPVPSGVPAGRLGPQVVASCAGSSFLLSCCLASSLSPLVTVGMLEW